MTPECKAVLEKLVHQECYGCGVTGKFQLQDRITVKRTWTIYDTAINHNAQEDEEDTDPYQVACRKCGEVLDLECLGLEDPVGTLVDEKDSW